ncbi:MAG TPA: beta-xylosidase [Verrucomicrobiae bacterium]|jgi:xylan 1,4-beta-xylosidase
MMRFVQLIIIVSAFLFAFAGFSQSASDIAFPVTITVDASQRLGELTPTWRFFGADEPNYAYMKDGKKLLSELGQLGKPQVYFRAHHLLISGDGSFALKWGSTSAYKEDAEGKPVYDWTINDKIFDTYLERGIKPYVEIGFMPEALSTHPQNYPHNPPQNRRAPVEGGQSYPPKDYAKWGELAHQWAKHCVEKYGKSEVEQWYWEVWNEPNISYWHGSRADYFKLYDYAVDGVRRALPTARVGGPETAGGAGGGFLRDFLEHCSRGTNFVTGKTGSPLDFVSFHAKGSPDFTNGHVRMGMANQFKDINGAFTMIASFPEFKKLPVIIGESDPEGCAACREPRDAYRNGTMYSSYTAASFSHEYELAASYGVNLQGALTWAFEFENQPPFAGFRQVASAGIDLPVLNVFRMFGKMSGQRLAVESSSGLSAKTIFASGVRGHPDVSALASLGDRQVAVLVWHYHDDDVPGPDASVNLSLNHIPFSDGKATVTRYVIDANHSNSYQVWLRMGSPQNLSDERRLELEKAGQLAMFDNPESIRVEQGKARLKFILPRQAVTLLLFAWN